MATAMYHHTCALLVLLVASASFDVLAAPAVSRVQRRQQQEGSMSIGPQVWVRALSLHRWALETGSEGAA